MTTTILLARHGETSWNRERRWQGHADPPLNEAGRSQARALAETFALAPPDALYSSDLVRARETAEIVSARLGLPVELDPRLREIDVGEWSGLKANEVASRYPDGLRRRAEGGTGWESGESYEAMESRVLDALRAVAAGHPRERVLVVTHGGPMRAVWRTSAPPQTAPPSLRQLRCRRNRRAVWPDQTDTLTGKWRTTPTSTRVSRSRWRSSAASIRTES